MAKVVCHISIHAKEMQMKTISKYSNLKKNRMSHASDTYMT